jgi:hypothetical protein
MPEIGLFQHCKALKRLNQPRRCGPDRRQSPHQKHDFCRHISWLKMIRDAVKAKPAPARTSPASPHPAPCTA